MIEIIPTCVPKDANDLSDGAKRIRSFTTGIHIDVDDGLFAPHLTWPYTDRGTFARFDLSMVGALNADVHLMVEDPLEIGSAFAREGAKRIMGHVEAFDSVDEAKVALSLWKQNGAQEAGLGMLWQTSLDDIEPLVAACDVVHIMMIETIGTQGIPYNPAAPARIAEFHKRFPDAIISVDGGVSEKNIVDLARAGASRFGVGSAITKAVDPKSAYEKLLKLAESAVE